LDPGLVAEKTLHRLKGVLSELTKLRVEQIEGSEPLESYGIDSVMIMQLNQRLGGVFGALSKTLFFEYPTLEAVAGHLVAEHGAGCAKWSGLDQGFGSAACRAPRDSRRSVA
jgi:aryl carrier-like protein